MPNGLQRLEDVSLVSIAAQSFRARRGTLPLFGSLTCRSTVSAALIREEDGIQKLVYFTSRALRVAEERYPQMEKLAFALVIAAWRLKPYL